ncbi:hypothetical protein [Flavisericum labens]
MEEEKPFTFEEIRVLKKRWAWCSNVVLWLENEEKRIINRVRENVRKQ